MSLAPRRRSRGADQRGRTRCVRCISSLKIQFCSITNAHTAGTTRWLLLAYWNKERISGIRILREVCELKQQTDKQIRKSYAICVKGQALSGGSKQSVSVKCTVLKTWSYAMANCFDIEAKAKNNESLRANWYVDSWIKRPLANLRPETFRMKMRPKNNPRKIFRLNDEDVKRLVSEVT
jgi:hypothetical protein